MVFVLSEAEDVAWPSVARGATRFDSGGLWWNRIVTEPALDDAGRRGFFEDHDVPLVDWRAAFEEYVGTRHGSISNYLGGDAPGPGSEPPDSKAVVVEGSPNDLRAWTWEVRIPHDLAAGRLELLSVHMTEDDRDDYLDWLPRGPLADVEIRRIGQWVEEHVLVPDRGVPASQAVEDWLVGEWLAETADA